MLSVSLFFIDMLRVVMLNVDVLSVEAENTKGGSITVPLTSCFIGLD